MQVKPETNRYVELTEEGRKRLEDVRRKYRKTLDDIAGEPETPSINTVKRAFRKGPVFVSTLERIWEYFRECAADQNEKLPYLIKDEDYYYVDAGPEPPEKVSSELPAPNRAA